VAAAAVRWISYNSAATAVLEGAKPMSVDAGDTWAAIFTVTIPDGGYLQWTVAATDTVGNAANTASGIRIDAKGGACP